MTSISATQYASYHSLAISDSASVKSSNSAAAKVATDRDDSATKITLSDAAKAALNQQDFATVIAETRKSLDALLTAAGVTSPAKDGKPTIDLAKLDRRQAFAAASNAGDKFTEDEQAAAAQEMQRRFDAALAGPAAVARVTGDLTDLYKAASDYLEGASAEEKATPIWADQKAAVVEGYKRAAATPGELPNIDNDPVADYLIRAEKGETAKPRDFDSVASDVRTALDKQYADAKASGSELVFSKFRKTGQRVDFAKFDSRSISAIALNQGDKFSDEEVFAAKGEMRARSSATLLAGFKASSSGTDPTAFSKSIISAFASLSTEERAAAGWSDSFYATALQNYQSSSKLAEMFSTAGRSGGGMSLLNYL
jgi:hypothetical protein